MSHNFCFLQTRNTYTHSVQDSLFPSYSKCPKFKVTNVEDRRLRRGEKKRRRRRARRERGFMSRQTDRSLLGSLLLDRPKKQSSGENNNCRNDSITFMVSSNCQNKNTFFGCVCLHFLRRKQTKTTRWTSSIRGRRSLHGTLDILLSQQLSIFCRGTSSPLLLNVSGTSSTCSCFLLLL